ncbi:hypothetical protein [Comamonas endophytica]|uniref:Outer membrane protein transport protein (OMPP1/FadL/TodX) n=1 Tax=Comamonas endophytica TaxID=2949090 RepID=A0ABY6G7A8_9BURK|nr:MULTISPECIES: hypothetical protein [unclassified Acidovorax]MCD2511244.1 hypothetical protein [Acidovorax sp. D4N7]UYG50640.1 hypothetical protein M9799_11100 [Acidovorax sp. 5MLIR]
MLPGDRWSMDLQADEHVEATLALRLAPALQAGATLALPRAGGMLHDRIHARAAMAWVGWELQPGWTLSAGWQHAGGRPAERPPVWSHAASPRPGVALQWNPGAGTTLALRGFAAYDKRTGGSHHCTTAQPFAVKRWQLKMKLKFQF